MEDDAGDPDGHDGRFLLGTLVTDNGDGTWHYEYALYNMNSHRSGQSFSVPVGAGVVVSDIGFHDVDYHSGDGIGGSTHDGSDWSVAVGNGAVTWSTSTFDADPNANALRWGTLYNFRFDADTGPVGVNATLGLFRPGTPTDLTMPTSGPAADTCPWDCGDDNGVVTVVDFLGLLGQWGMVGTSCDFDGGGVSVTDYLELLGNWGPCP